MTIKLDVSKATGIVIVCTECYHWRAFRFGFIAAEDAAIEHEINCHPDSRDVRDRRATRERTAAYTARERARHAVDSSD